MRPTTSNIILFLFLFFCKTISAQTTQTIYYTTRDGLPSNALYRTAIDKRGFLWIATENGLGRFDGKNFKTYTTAEGLTDNEVVDLYIDSSNVIWAIPFRRSPCFYNEQTDRFENEQTNAELQKIFLANTHTASVLRYGGVAFINNQRNVFIYKNGKTTQYNCNFPLRSGMPFKAVEYSPDKFIFFSEDSIRYFSAGQITGAGLFKKKIQEIIPLPDRLYISNGNSIEVSSYGVDGKLVPVIKKTYPFNIRIFCYTGHRFAIGSYSGATYLINKNTLEIEDQLPGNVLVRNVQEDKDGNKWLSTMESGLVKVQQKRISSYNTKPELLQNYNALIRLGNGLVAGNNHGEIIFYDGLYGIKRMAFADSNKTDAWVRKIISLDKENIFVSTQAGSYIISIKDHRILQKMEGPLNKSSKMAIKVNDSILCLGSHSAVYKYNYRQGVATDSIIKRVISLAKDREENIYIGSNDGLYLWKDKKLQNLGAQFHELSYRVNCILLSPDDLTWVGLATDSLVVMKNNERLMSIPLGGLIPGNICKSLFCNKPGEIWLGTNKGLNHINYQLENGKLIYNNTYFGVADGLLGEQVNDIFITNDTAYVATSGGMNYLPVGLSVPVSDIATFITRVNINNQDKDIRDEYQLDHNENNINVEFAGVDLTGFIPIFQYCLNDGAWQNIETQLLVLKELAPGSYKIRIRAYKRDGTPSAKYALVRFNIKTPFWKSSGFWVVVVLVAFFLVIYFLQKRNRIRQKQAIEKISTEKRLAELEMQALMAQINPHFVFNCLNSIKGFVYDKDFKQADKYLDKFSELLRSTMDNAEASVISLQKEIAYLDTYLQLEKLRFENKFNYSITASPEIDQQQVFVPAMLLQPYVENAIRHGVRHLPGEEGMITITANKEETFLVFTIDDNGVGRERAQQLKTAGHIEYQSRGMSLSKRRAELYGILQDIIDKKDAAGNSTGTRIVLKIPLSLRS